MKYFIQYHLVEKNEFTLPDGHVWNGREDLSLRSQSTASRRSRIYTGKESVFTCIGHRLFLIVAYNTPKRNLLWSWMEIDGVEQSGSEKKPYLAVGYCHPLEFPIPLESQRWRDYFRDHKKSGLHELDDAVLLGELLKYCGIKWSGHSSAPSQPFPFAVPKNISREEIETVLREVAIRRGQASFRYQLMEVYEGKCAVSGFGAIESLEAAHIIPFAQAGGMFIQNGLLLRSDIHTLFDLGLLLICPQTFTVTLSDGLMATEYAELDGRKIKRPNEKAAQPSKKALQLHWDYWHQERSSEFTASE